MGDERKQGESFEQLKRQIEAARADAPTEPTAGSTAGQTEKPGKTAKEISGGPVGSKKDSTDSFVQDSTQKAKGEGAPGAQETPKQTAPQGSSQTKASGQAGEKDSAKAQSPKRNGLDASAEAAAKEQTPGKAESSQDKAGDAGESSRSRQTNTESERTVRSQTGSAGQSEVRRLSEQRGLSVITGGKNTAGTSPNGRSGARDTDPYGRSGTKGTAQAAGTGNASGSVYGQTNAGGKRFADTANRQRTLDAPSQTRERETAGRRQTQAGNGKGTQTKGGEPNRRPARSKSSAEGHTLVSTRTLFVILGILCVILVGALIWQEYYFSHTYEKGELAELTSGESEQRLKYMSETSVNVGISPENVPTQKESGTESPGEPQSETSESGSEGESLTESGTASSDTQSEEGADTDASLPADPAAAGTSSAGITVESAEAANLKKQLVNVLPGIQAPGKTSAQLIADADLLAEQYDYDAACALLKSCTTYETDTEMQGAVSGYESLQASCVAYPVDQVTHVFFHTLIKDAAKAFDGDEYEAGYNQYMVTIREFNSIIEQMYEKGYVMVSLEDMAAPQIQEDGTVKFTAGSILLPKGKIPFVLSQDDVSYYHYMDGDGFASRLIVDENGDIKNEYLEDDGSVSVGDYDLVPLIDRFVEQHPDFSYRGAKGYIALTGYDGILGYRTDICYKTRENLDTYQEQFFAKHPDFDEADYEWECAEARKVAEALKEDGWRFASHTWGHVGLGEGATTLDQFKTDTDKWQERVKPLIGETDVLIYAFGGDIGGVEEYAGQRYEYLKEKGFQYFCGVDSAVHWVQLTDGYLRQGRRNIDGYRMFYNPDMLSDLFDVSKAWDPLRPETVPQI